MTRILIPALAALSIAACSGPAPKNEALPANSAVAANPAVLQPVNPVASAPAARLEADYLGRWTGVEGMFLNVTKRDGGGVTLEMQWDLDNKGSFPGDVTAEGLRFMRNGVAETATFSDGNATGLKWLAGKKECLTVKTGEGYCRD